MKSGALYWCVPDLVYLQIPFASEPVFQFHVPVLCMKLYLLPLPIFKDFESVPKHTFCLLAMLFKLLERTGSTLRSDDTYVPKMIVNLYSFCCFKVHTVSPEIVCTHFPVRAVKLRKNPAVLSIETNGFLHLP